MTQHLAKEHLVEPGWVDVSYPLYYWAIDQTSETLAPGVAKTYVALARALAAAILITAKGGRRPSS